VPTTCRLMTCIFNRRCRCTIGLAGDEAKYLAIIIIGIEHSTNVLPYPSS
jgi:hypothetical protein